MEKYIKDKERVGLIADIRNINYRQTQAYGNCTYCYGKMKADILAGRECVAAVAVDSIICNNGKDSARVFHNQLRRDFDLELVEASNSKGKYGGVDVIIGAIASKLVLEKGCNVIEIVSGDGDFSKLCETLESWGATVNVTGYEKGTSRQLQNRAKICRKLDDMPIIMMMPAYEQVAEVE